MSQETPFTLPIAHLSLVVNDERSDDSVAKVSPHLISRAQLLGLIEDKFDQLPDLLNDGFFYLVDEDTVFLHNQHFYQKFGIENSQCRLNNWMSLLHPSDVDMMASRVKEHFAQKGKVLTYEFRVRKQDGSYDWIEGNAVTVEYNATYVLLGWHVNITEKRQKERDIAKAVYVDSFSGLPNLIKLNSDIENQVHTGSSDYSLVYIQIDGVKSFVNLYGQNVLQDLVHYFVRSLKSFSDDFIDIYRVHTDNFVVLLQGHSSVGELSALGEQIVHSYRKAVAENDILYGKNIKLGIYPNFDKNLSSDELLRIAEKTCQFADSHAASDMRFYAGDTKQKVDRFFFIERGLRQAIDEDAISVKFQPIVCASSNKIASFEALVRWRSKQWGEIYPDEFISVAEQKGFIVDLGYLVFTKACEFIQVYRKHNKSNARVNVNVSVLQLLNSQFPDKVKSIADMMAIPTKSIVLELTETIILDGNQSAINQLQKLSEYGFLLSLDDFGAGYSSLHSFFDLPLQQIKIDKSMAWKCLNNPATYEYLRFVTQLCREHNVDIVIEGIESADMQKRFISMGASYLQGYWFSKPLSVASASQYTDV